MEWGIDFISEEDFKAHVESTIEKYGEKLESYDIVKFNKNIIDPIKLIFDKKDHTLIGGAIVGDNAGELLGEIGLALEMDCDAEDIALTIHAHPTLHVSVGMAAEIYEGSITDLPNAKAKKK